MAVKLFYPGKLNAYRHEHMIADLDEIQSASGKLCGDCLFSSLLLFQLHIIYIT